MAAKVHQMYGFTIDEAARLTPERLTYLQTNAINAGEQMYLSSTEAQAALKENLAPVTAAIRAQLKALPKA